MCTVSYLPLKGGGYILTSNRDEAPRRNAISLQRISVGTNTLLFPKDPEAGGSWFCVSAHQKAACLLNGAYIPYTPGPQYAHSRGTVLIELMKQPSAKTFIEQYDLSLTAPFTLVYADDGFLEEYIWDGTSLVHKQMDASLPAFWSSVTLYPEDVRVWRRSLFHLWLSDHVHFAQHEIMRFHQYGGDEDNWNGFVMNRQEQVKTLSITSVQKHPDNFTLKHMDLERGETVTETLHLNTAYVAET